LTQGTSFVPTCRLVSSPEAGPRAIVGTLDQEYPLLQQEDAVPTRLSLVTWGTTPDSTTWMDPGSPCGLESDTLQYTNSGSGPHGKVSDPCTCRPDLRSMIQDPRECSPDLQVGSRIPLHGIQTTHGWVPGLRGREYPGLAQAGVRCRHVSWPSLVWTCPYSATAPRPGGDPMLTRGLPRVT
jgi:hypothetical protein